jgi:hypothetical protein
MKLEEDLKGTGRDLLRKLLRELKRGAQKRDSENGILKTGTPSKCDVQQKNWKKGKRRRSNFLFSRSLSEMVLGNGKGKENSKTQTRKGAAEKFAPCECDVQQNYELAGEVVG